MCAARAAAPHQMESLLTRSIFGTAFLLIRCTNPETRPYFTLTRFSHKSYLKPAPF